MRRIIAEKQDFVRSEISIEEAISWAKETNQPYKLELFERFKKMLAQQTQKSLRKVILSLVMARKQ